LGLFDYRLHHLDHDHESRVDPSSFLVHRAHEFMVIAANCYDSEEARTNAIREILESILEIRLVWKVQMNQFRIQPDAIFPDVTPFFVVEVKNEAGLEGDASLQAALLYPHLATTSVRSFYVVCLVIFY
jgi:hypothetical protein